MWRVLRCRRSAYGVACQVLELGVEAGQALAKRVVQEVQGWAEEALAWAVEVSEGLQGDKATLADAATQRVEAGVALMAAMARASIAGAPSLGCPA
jgi:hypothetical protein